MLVTDLIVKGIQKHKQQINLSHELQKYLYNKKTNKKGEN